MKNSAIYTFFLLSLAWLLLTIVPPWQFTHFESGANRILEGSSLIYAPIWMPPVTALKGSGFDSVIAFVPLSLEFLVAAIICLLAVRFSKFGKSSDSDPDQRLKIGPRAVLKGLSAMFFVATFALLAPQFQKGTAGPDLSANDTTPGTITRTSVATATRDIAAGETITTDMVALRMVAEKQRPEKAVGMPGSALGRKTTRKIEKDQMLVQDDLEKAKP